MESRNYGLTVLRLNQLTMTNYLRIALSAVRVQTWNEKTNYVDTFVSYVVADSDLNANVIYALGKDTKLTNTSGPVLGAVI